MNNTRPLVSCSRAALGLLLIIFASTAQAGTYYSRASGQWNDPTRWSQATYGGAASATYPGQMGAGDVVYISGHTITANVTPPFAVGSITLNQLGAAAATKLDMSVAGITLTAGAFTMVDNNVNQHMDLEVSSTAIFQVNGNFQVTRSTTNARNTRLQVYVRTNGRINVTGNFTYTYNRSSSEGQYEILLSNSGRIDVGGNWSCTIGNNSGGNDQFNFQMNNTPQVNVTGTTSFISQSNTDGDDMVLDLNGGTFTSTGGMTWRVASTATSSSEMDIQIDGAAVVANGGLTCDQQDGDTYEIRLNSNSTASAASITVTGNTTISHTDGEDQTIQLNNNATFSTSGNVTMTFTEGDGVFQNLDINGGTFSAAGNLTATINGTGNAHELNIDIDGTGHLNVGTDLTINVQEGDDLDITLNGGSGTTAQLNVGRDFTIDKDPDAGDVYIDLNQGSLLAVGRDLIGTNTADNDDQFFITLDDTPTLTIGRNLNLTLDAGNDQDDEVGVFQEDGSINITGNVVILQSAGDDAYWDQDGGSAIVGGNFTMQTTGGGDTEITLDNDAQLSVGGDLMLDLDAGDDGLLSMNENQGSGSLLSVGDDLIIDHEGPANDMELLLNNSSTLNITGDLLWDESSSGGDYARMRLDNDVNAASIQGNFAINLLTGTSTNDDLDYDQQGGTMTIGGSATFLHAAGDDMYAHVHNSSVFDVTGDLNFQHTGGDDFKFDQSSNNSWVYVDGDVNMTDANTGSTPTEYEQDNWSNSKILGDFNITATAGGQCLIDMNNSAYMEIGGSFIRQASPNRYGTLSSSNGTTIEYDGISNTQVLSQDAGNGGDSWDYERVVIDNSFGTSPQLTTVGTTTINEALTLTDGIVATTSAALLVIASGTTSTAGSVASHVDGPLKKVGSTGFTFPVGDNGRWARLRMEGISNANGGTEFVCEYFAQPSPNNSVAYYTPTIDHVSYVEHWDLARVLDGGFPASCNVRLYWEDAAFSGIVPANISDLRVGHFSSSTNQWENQGGTATGSSTGNVVSTTALINFSPISFASRAGNNPLPVELLEFHAQANGDVVDLFWSTATELNSDHFEVERSADGMQFTTIAEVTAAGTSQALLHYAAQDMYPLRGVNYYRLRQVDSDGAFAWSGIVTVFMGAGAAGGPGPLVFPNPGNGDVSVALDLDSDAEVTFEVVDASGRVALQERHLVTARSVIDLATSPLVNGSYLIRALRSGELLGAARWLKLD